jgi:hypothetical protein
VGRAAEAGSEGGITMPIDRKSAANARAAAAKYAYCEVDSLLDAVKSGHGTVRDAVKFWLQAAYMRGYNRAKRKGKNAK